MDMRGRVRHHGEMRWSRVVLATALSVTSSPVHAAQTPAGVASQAAPISTIEGPAPAPTLEDRWLLFSLPPGADDTTGEVVGAISLGAISAITLIPFVAVAAVFHRHREPLRDARANVSVTGGGLKIAF